MTPFLSFSKDDIADAQKGIGGDKEKRKKNILPVHGCAGGKRKIWDHAEKADRSCRKNWCMTKRRKKRLINADIAGETSR